MKQLNFLSPAILISFLLATIQLNAQWLALPNPPISPLSTSVNPCTTTLTQPGFIRPLADDKILYTSLCASSSIHYGPYGYFMLSNDNLSSAQNVASASTVWAFNTSNSGELVFCMDGGSSTFSFNYSANLFGSATQIGLFNAPPVVVASAITPSHIYAAFSFNSTLIYRFNKTGTSYTFTSIPGYYPIAEKLNFINDSVGFLLATAASNQSKTTLLKLDNSGPFYQPVLVDSIDAIVDYQISSGNIYLIKKSGTVFKSIDKGASFTALNSAPNGSYTCIHFANNNTGFIGGKNGVLLKTIDGGANWTNETSNTTQTIYSIYTFNYSSYFVEGSAKVFISQQALEISEKKKNNSTLSIFPNPAENELTVNYTYTTGEMELQITDIGGRKLIEANFTGTLKLDTSTLLTGIYFVKVVDANHTLAIKKLVISK